MLKYFTKVRVVLAFVSALAVGAGLVACSSDSSSEGNGEKKIERVVALDWRYEEILKALDVDPVGIVEIGKSEAPTTLKGQLGQATSVPSQAAELGGYPVFGTRSDFG